ncbi:MAG: putative rRNA maturation factor [Parcubacteria group bacterium GW2011_GWF2_38_76]|nr:MAG: putative rRNA maturation factor [Parcubacteria group bacterium GW2011_GWF2_38_76]HBM45608.1 rRNA maturation RNase YbeY [Patescibacteria group bacterium]
MLLVRDFKTKIKISKIGYEKIADFALGKNFELSLVFVGKKKIHDLNLKFRQKDKPTNILSFPLSKNEGEIFICPAVAKKEIKIVEKPLDEYIKYLFIHGITHLKGFDHGSKMEREEEKIRRKFLKKRFSL